MSESRGRIASHPRVPLLDLQLQYRALREPIEQAIREVCDSQQFILGPRVAALEERVAAYCGAAHGIGVSSGTDALLCALMALGIGPGDDVITTPYTFFATAGTIARVGARPVFCDIHPKTFNLDPGSVSAFLTEQCERRGDHLVNRATGNVVRAIVPVHLYGQMADMEALLEIATSHALWVVEDAAQAIGSELPGGRRAGALGHIGCFSFFPTKNLGAFGDAGMCVTNDPELAQKLRIIRVHGGHPKYHHSVIGGNFRLDELQAAVLLVKLDHLDTWHAARQRNAAHYTNAIREAGLSHRIGAPFVLEGYRHVFNQYVVRAARRDELREHLTAQGVGTEIYYPVALHEQVCFAYLGYRNHDHPHAARAAAETLALPIYPELTEAQLDYVVAQIAEFYRRSGEPASKAG